MKNFLPTIMCLATLLYVAFKDSTFNMFPPFTWYDIIGILALIGLVASFVWGMVQQKEENDLDRSVKRRDLILQSRFPNSGKPAGGYQPAKTEGKPVNPPKAQ